MATSAGESLLFGIRGVFDPRGIERGAGRASGSLGVLGATADRTAVKLQAAAAAAAAGFASLRAGQLLRDKVLKPMLDEATSFQREFSQLQFVTGAVGAELKELENIVIQTGIKTQFSPQEAAKGLRLLRQSGLDTVEALKSLPAVLDLATASGGQLSLEDAARGTTAAMVQFGATSKGAAQTMSVFAEATRSTKLEWKDLNPLMRSAGNAMQKLKIGPPIFFALAGAMVGTGKSAADAGNALKAFGRQLGVLESARNRQERLEARAAKSGRKSARLVRQNVFWMRKLGLEVFDTNGKMKPTPQILREIMDRSKELSEKNQLIALTSTMGTNAQDLIFSLLGMDKAAEKTGVTFEQMIATLKKAEKGILIREAAELVEKTFAGLVRFIKGSVATLQILFGRDLIAAITSSVEKFRDLLNVFVEFIQQNPFVRKALLAIIVGLTALSITAGTATLALAALAAASAFMLPAFGKLGAASGLFSEGMKGLATILGHIGPPLLKFAKILGVLGVVFTVFKVAASENIFGIGDDFKEFFENLKLVAQGFFTFFSGGIFKGAEEVALAKKLKKKSLDGFVLILLQWKERLFKVGKGILGGLLLVFKGFMVVMTPLILVGKLLIFVFNKVMKAFDAEPIKNTLVLWETFGLVLGVIAGVTLVKVVAGLLLTTASLIVQTAVLAASRLAWLGNIALLSSVVALQALLAGTTAATVIGFTLMAAIALIAGFAIGTALLELAKWAGWSDKDQPNILQAMKELFSFFTDEGSTKFFTSAFDFGLNLGKHLINGFTNAIRIGDVFDLSGPETTKIRGTKASRIRASQAPNTSEFETPLELVDPSESSSFFSPVGRHSSPGPMSREPNQSIVKNTTFNGGINLSIQSAKPEDINPAVDIIMSRLAEDGENEAETSF